MQTSKPSSPVQRSWFIPALLGLAIISIIAGGFAYQKYQAQSADAALPDGCNNRAFAEVGGPFSLVDEDAKPVTDKTFIGKPALIYFGFTYCPDICPLSLQTMRLALDEAQAQGGKDIEAIQPLLISIDPQRDTPTALKTYIESAGFPANLKGLTGSEEQVKAVGKAFKVGFRKSPQEGGGPKDYLMDHTSIFYLLNSKGKLATFFSSDPDPKDMGRCIAALSKKGL